jgi:hypothetical protein
MKKKAKVRYGSLRLQLPHFWAHCVCSWRKIAISLIDPGFGEQTAQACAIA